MPNQKTVCGTLDTIAGIAEAARITPPAVTVVGEVVKLRDQLQWLEKRPLFGRTIVVTRSRQQASTLCHELRTAGARVIECPTIKIVQHYNSDEFSTFIKEIHRYQHLVFTSVNGVHGFIESLHQKGLDLRFLADKKIVCIGPATAGAFREKGIIPDHVPSTYVAESLLPYFSGLAKPAGIAILRAEKAREILPKTLEEAGHLVRTVSLYHTDYDRPDNSEVIGAFSENQVDLVTFTSSSTVEGFARIIEGTSIRPDMIKAVSIGPVTSATCREYGFSIAAEAEEFTIPGLIESIGNYFAQKQENK
jgi:uroporphyrinogen III methyltransferase/synthase